MHLQQDVLHLHHAKHGKYKAYVVDVAITDVDVVTSFVKSLVTKHSDQALCASARQSWHVMPHMCEELHTYQMCP